MMVVKTRIVSKPIGLGDIVSRVLHEMGFDQRPGCGCNARQTRLNQMIVFLPKDNNYEQTGRQ
jgi:hypothetical protein